MPYNLSIDYGHPHFCCMEWNK